MPTYTLYSIPWQSDVQTPVAILEAKDMDSVPTKITAHPDGGDAAVSAVESLKNGIERSEDLDWATVGRLGVSYGGLREHGRDDSEGSPPQRRARPRGNAR